MLESVVGQDDAVGIGPVVVQALPDAARALRDIGFVGTFVVHLEVAVGAVAKDLRAVRTEVRERRDKSLGRRCRRLAEMNGRHLCSFVD